MSEGFKDSGARKWHTFLPRRLRKADRIKGGNYKEHRELWGIMGIFFTMIVMMASQGCICKKKVSE